MDSRQILKDRLAGTNRKSGLKYLGPIIYEGQKIAQFHNPDLFINDIFGENESKQFTSILIIGSPGTGKTTLATFIGHELHTRNPYYIVHLGKKELLNFDRIMDSLPNQDIILIFDDVSLIFKHIKDPIKRTTILTTLTEARHPKFQTKDRKVVVIANIHYVNSIEKMWRSQGSWKIYTDMSNEEIQNFNYMTKSEFKQKVKVFAQITLEQFRRHKFTVSLTNNTKETYTINKPFRFIMVYDNSSLRFFLVPNKSCNICSSEKNKQSKVKAIPKDIIALSEKYYGKYGPKGLKDALIILGQTAQLQNKEVYAMNNAMEILSTFDVDPEELSLELRRRAQIKGTRIYTIHKKKTDFLKDLEDIQKNEGNVTFASEALKNDKDDKKLLDDEIEEFNPEDIDVSNDEFFDDSETKDEETL